MFFLCKCAPSEPAVRTKSITRKRGRSGKSGGAMHVKNCTSAYISPATSGVILAISQRWEPEPPGRESFPFFSFRLACYLPLSL